MVERNSYPTDKTLRKFEKEAKRLTGGGYNKLREETFVGDHQTVKIERYADFTLQPPLGAIRVERETVFTIRNNIPLKTTTGEESFPYKELLVRRLGREWNIVEQYQGIEYINTSGKMQDIERGSVLFGEEYSETPVTETDVQQIITIMQTFSKKDRLQS